MGKHTLRTDKILSAYRVLSTSKYTKLADDDKIKAWKIARALKPFADKFEEDSKDAAEKLKPTEDFGERLQKAQEYEQAIRKPDFNAETDKLPMGTAEYGEFLKEFQNYRKLVDDAIKEFAEKEVDVEFDELSEDAFGKLMASNEWTMEQTMEIGNIIV